MGSATLAGVVPAEVAARTEGVMESRMLTKGSKAAGLVVLCLLGVGVGGFQVPANAQHSLEPANFQIKPEFREKQGVDFRKTGPFADLPVKIRLFNVTGTEQKFSSLDFEFALLDERGEIVKGKRTRPHSSPPLHPAALAPTHWEVLLKGKEVVDDPHLGLLRNALGTSLKTGRYTLVCEVRGLFATISFEVINE
jgi:hypothetical protein